MKKILRLLRSKNGYTSSPLVVAIALGSLMFFVVLWQIIRLITISAGVKDAVQSAVIATSVGITAMSMTAVARGIRAGIGFREIRGNRQYLRAMFTEEWMVYWD